METMIALLTILPSIKLFVTAEIDYSYSGPNGNELNQCYFSGYASNSGSDLCSTTSLTAQDLHQGSTLTWKVLTLACPYLVYAGCADPDWIDGELHNMTRDLVWDQDPNCGQCPRCPCNDGDSETYYLRNYTTFDTSRYFQVSICYECSCDYFYQYFDEETNLTQVYGKLCSTGGYTEGGDAQLLTFNSPSELEDVQCPYSFSTEITTTMSQVTSQYCDDGDGNSFQAGEYFFFNDGNNCDTYCYCNENNEIECQQGWDNILNNHSDGMKYAFLDECDLKLDDAWNDTTRYYKEEGACSNFFYQGSSNCPLPLCREGDKPGNEQYPATEYGDVVFDDNGNVDTEYYDCLVCTCVNDGDQNLTDCYTDFGAPDYVSEADACDYNVWPFYNCTRDNDGRYGSYTSYYYYCGWSEIKVPSTFVPDTVCIGQDFEDGPDWDGQDRHLCDAFYGYENLAASETGLCSVTPIQFTVMTYDCVDQEWKSGTQNLTISSMCCGSVDGTPACNAQIPGKLALGEENECLSNENVKEFYEAIYECQSGNRGVKDLYMREEYCGTELPEAENIGERVCDLIEQKWIWETSCECKAYQILEKMYGESDYENNIRLNLQREFDEETSSLKNKLQLWNDYYQCGHTFECDIYASITTTETPETTSTPAPVNSEDDNSDGHSRNKITTAVIVFTSMSALAFK